jgi:hypothetical protein
MLNKVFSALGKGGTAAATTALRYGNKFLGSSAGKQTLLNASTHAKWQAGFMAYTLFFSRGTPEEKIHSAATQLGTFMLTAGMKSGWRQAGWQVALALAPNLPDIGRGLVHGYRGVMEARSMAYVPFSYSTLNMDQALASMQYAQSRMNDAYSSLGNEAAWMACRYCQR